MIELERESSNAAHWTREQYEARVAADNSPETESLALVAEERSQPSEGLALPASQVIGFLVAHRVDTEWELENIVVSENVRRGGIGFILATKFADYVREANGTGIFLEVRESNQAARALYRKQGFQEAGRRKDYYSNPPDDAIVCRIKL